jgi:hypothetical protein
VNALKAMVRRWLWPAQTRLPTRMTCV